MPEQKLEAELNLALSLPEEERMKNPVLSAGYEAALDQWKLILLYNGSLTDIQNQIDFTFVPLLGNYAIIQITSANIPALLTYPQILYLELSRPLYINEITGISASCFNDRPFTLDTPAFPTGGNTVISADNLTGLGVAIGILDSGVDFRHPDFQTSGGQSRILSYWDQSLPYDGTNSYGFGFIFSNEMLNRLLSGETKNSSSTDSFNDNAEPSPDFSGHGTHIAGICAGNGRSSGGRNHGAAPEASLIVVKLKNEADSVFTDYANLMMAVDYTVRFSSDNNIPLSINISYGSNDGSHDGRGLIERFIENCIFYGKNTVTIATGNEGLSKRHSSVQVNTGENVSVDFSVAPSETGLYLQLWKHYGDQFTYALSLPNQSAQINIPDIPGISRYTMGQNQIRLIISEPTPFQPLQELFIAIIPSAGNMYISPGIWRFQINSLYSASGSANLWLPSKEATNSSTGFLNPSSDMTFTIPSTGRNILSVSGYDSTTDVFAAFSGRGFSNPQNTKPDLTAPAVNILSTAPGGGYSIRTGTSMAAPFVTGASALLMQYGIVEGKDPFLYGEKIKALLQKGARPLPAFSQYPNASVGWGALCFRDIFS